MKKRCMHWDIPVVSLITSQTGAVNSGLLTSTDSDNLTVASIANGVTLGVFQCDGGHDQIANGTLGQCAGLGDGVFEQGGIDSGIVALLLELQAEQCLAFDWVWFVGGVDLSADKIKKL